MGTNLPFIKFLIHSFNSGFTVTLNLKVNVKVFFVQSDCTLRLKLLPFVAQLTQ
jgi:hypothetical protein